MMSELVGEWRVEWNLEGAFGAAGVGGVGRFLGGNELGQG